MAEPQGDGSTLPTDVLCLAVLRGNGVIAYDPADGVRLRLLWRAQRRRAVSLWAGSLTSRSRTRPSRPARANTADQLRSATQ